MMEKEKPVWTIVKILEWTKQYFADKGVETPRLDAEVLLCDVLKCQRINLYVNFDKPLEDDELKKYRDYVAKRANNEPLAYILGHKAFMHSEFKVTKDTLVPRPETELLVEQVAKLNKDKNPGKILDLGCGSGAIIVSLLQMLPTARGMAIDINAGAVKTAMENAESLGVAHRCCGLVSDLFSQIPVDIKFDVIVSNPPYIPTQEIAGLAADVLKEPRGALDGGPKGLNFYERILQGINGFLTPEGMVAFEVGIGQGEQVAALCKAQNLIITAVCNDYANINRMVFATKEGSKYENEILALK
ncbi:MAG: peptide chain release factor N(5)-glutamine methyltransferase [Acidaminococcaceae bacterium]